MKKKEPYTVQLNGHTLAVCFRKYRDSGRTGIVLICEDGEPYATATMNVPEVNLAENEVLIKNYSENRGVLEALTEAGIIENTGRSAVSGFVTAPICRLLLPLV